MSNITAYKVVELEEESDEEVEDEDLDLEEGQMVRVDQDAVEDAGIDKADENENFDDEYNYEQYGYVFEYHDDDFRWYDEEKDEAIDVEVDDRVYIVAMAPLEAGAHPFPEDVLTPVDADEVMGDLDIDVDPDEAEEEMSSFFNDLDTVEQLDGDTSVEEGLNWGVTVEVVEIDEDAGEVVLIDHLVNTEWVEPIDQVEEKLNMIRDQPHDFVYDMVVDYYPQFDSDKARDLLHDEHDDDVELEPGLTWGERVEVVSVDEESNEVTMTDSIVGTEWTETVSEIEVKLEKIPDRPHDHLYNLVADQYPTLDQNEVHELLHDYTGYDTEDHIEEMSSGYISEDTDPLDTEQVCEELGFPVPKNGDAEQLEVGTSDVPGITRNQMGLSPWPESWRNSNRPARLIAMDAWISMGRSFRGCRRSMVGSIRNPNRFCAAFKDSIYGHTYWREGGG